MEHYCWTMRTLQSEASNLRKLREDAANNLKKVTTPYTDNTNHIRSAVKRMAMRENLKANWEQN